MKIGALIFICGTLSHNVIPQADAALCSHSCAAYSCTSASHAVNMHVQQYVHLVLKHVNMHVQG